MSPKPDTSSCSSQFHRTGNLSFVPDTKLCLSLNESRLESIMRVSCPHMAWCDVDPEEAEEPGRAAATLWVLMNYG